MQTRQAPELEVSQWLNVDAPLSLAALKGKVIMLHAFQMLCPACVHHSIPLARRMQATFDEEEAVVIGLHTVFENHAAMGAEALAGFIDAQQITFPVGIDAQDAPAGEPGSFGDGIPRTMRAYGMQGTPTLLLIDHLGHIRLHRFGQVDPLAVGASIGILLAERRMALQRTSDV